MFKTARYLSFVTLLAIGVVGCGDDESDRNCSDLRVNAGADKITVINKGTILKGSVTISQGDISSYEWRRGTSSLSTTASFTYYPTSIGNEVLTFIATDDEGCVRSDNMTLIVKSDSIDNSQESEEEADSQNNSSENSKYSWSNGKLKASITSLKKTGEWITINATYKNLSEEDITLHIYSYETQLLDEDGNIWNFKEDTAKIFRTRIILPSRQIKTEMKFKAKDSQNGTKFDLILSAHPSEFTHRILSIKPF